MRPPERRARLLAETRVEMRDGVHLRTLRFGPSGGGRHPTILIRTPYGIGWGAQLPWLPLFAPFLARRGYHVVLQDTRGRYGSDGHFYPMRHEADDGHDTLAWLETQPWFDGNLGMWGASYFGYTQWSVAEKPPPYLKALVPIITTTDFHSMFYVGGAFSLASALRWASGNGDRRGRLAPERRLPAASRTRPLRDALDAVGRRAAFYEDWVDHPERDEYWGGIDRIGARGTQIPVLSVAGLYDMFCGPQIADFATLGDAACLDFTPAAHGSYAISPRKLGWRRARIGGYFATQLDFLDHHLQGRPLARARVRHYVVGEDRFADAPSWPPPDAARLRMHLRSRGRLDAEPPGADEAPDRFVYDPADPVPSRGGTFLGPRCGPADQRPLESRRDVLRYDTDPLHDPLELAGPVHAELCVSSDAPATDFTAKLVHLPADATRPALNLCDGIARVAHVDG